MPRTGEIKIVANIHFIFVPEYPESKLRAHWATLNGNRVHIYLPGFADHWIVSVYDSKTKNELHDAEIDSMRTDSEDEAFKYAVFWALYDKYCP
ncbi:MAG: hypothetical protein ACOYUZ_00560 [Patescibacteria group bacterium]